MAAMIGTGPHKGSHTAVALGAAEEPLGTLRVRACPDQAGALVAGCVRGRSGPGRSRAPGGWAACWRSSWSPPVSGGRDVQPKLAARVLLLLHTGNTGKNDSNDARSVAVAALRSAAGQEVIADGHARVLKVWAKRHRDLSRARNQAVCRNRCR